MGNDSKSCDLATTSHHVAGYEGWSRDTVPMYYRDSLLGERFSREFLYNAATSALDVYKYESTKLWFYKRQTRMWAIVKKIVNAAHGHLLSQRSHLGVASILNAELNGPQHGSAPVPVRAFTANRCLAGHFLVPTIFGGLIHDDTSFPTTHSCAQPWCGIVNNKRKSSNGLSAAPAAAFSPPPPAEVYGRHDGRIDPTIIHKLQCPELVYSCYVLLCTTVLWLVCFVLSRINGENTFLRDGELTLTIGLVEHAGLQTHMEQQSVVKALSLPHVSVSIKLMRGLSYDRLQQWQYDKNTRFHPGESRGVCRNRRDGRPG
ncbi:hypothetical protein EVAR_36835_1 [Eumeta japonica]|uniref:Uncharacterized protein n=1 Tax=Eumeta variegata TaxID=151549 RepID=A0A4C1WBG3_EUMVA|nr:hypothetical protein EVAR_36835_1 [Eumeta japonica]